MQISASILSCNLLKIEEEIDKILPYIDRIHYDVMDGHFVPYISFGNELLFKIKEKYKVPIDSHLMVTNPEQHIELYSKFSNIIFIHPEIMWNKYDQDELKTKDYINHCLNLISYHDCEAGLAINPETTIDQIVEFLPNLKHVMIMSVQPGLGGQECILETLDKIPQLKTQNPKLKTSTDGGINDKTAPIAISKGADILVVGSYLMKAKDKKEATQKIVR